MATKVRYHQIFQCARIEKQQNLLESAMGNSSRNTDLWAPDIDPVRDEASRPGNRYSTSDSNPRP